MNDSLGKIDEKYGLLTCWLAPHIKRLIRDIRVYTSPRFNKSGAWTNE